MLRHVEIRVDRLDAAARGRLVEEMRGIFSEIFEGPFAEAMLQGYIGGSRDEIVLDRVFDDRGVMVGFNLVVVTDLEVDGRPVAIMRATSGLIPSQRGESRCFPFYVAQGARLLRERRGQEMYFYGNLAHPSSFRIAARNIAIKFPEPGAQEDARMARLLTAVADALGVPRVAGDAPWVARRPVHIPSADFRPRARAYDALDAWWDARVPTPSEGRCIMMLAPVSWANLVRTGLRFALDRGRRLAQRWGALRRLTSQGALEVV